MSEYVLGFLFGDGQQVLLIRKNKPTWQAGFLNGIGGKIESGETPAQAMCREFREEAGLDIGAWKQFAVMTGPDWSVTCFFGWGELRRAVSLTDEKLVVANINDLPKDCLYNLRWLIPLARDVAINDVVTVRHK